MSGKLRIILIIIITILAAGVGFLGYNFLAKQSAYKKFLENPEKYPVDYNALKKAVANKDPSYCENLKQETKDNCLYDIATENNDVSFCASIIDSTLQNNCQEKINAEISVSNNTINGCLNLQSTELKKQCLLEIFRNQSDLKFCIPVATEFKGLCEDLININMAYNKKDQKICDQIQNESYKIECVNAIKSIPIDSDKDGVPDYLEMSYGTDPFNPQSK